MDVPPHDRLVVLHNLSLPNLEIVLRLGGLPVPSLGVTKAISPYTSFGEISLIGTRTLADPQYVTVYACDAYTPSAPKTRNGRLRVAEHVDEAVRRMTSSATRKRRGLYGTGRLLADVAGCFESLEAMQAARDKVVDGSRARAEWNYVDGLLNRFVLGVAPFHRPLKPISVARRETSVMKALLTAYRRGASRRVLLDVLTKRRFPSVTPELVDTGMEILAQLPHVSTPYFEAKPSRLVGLEEFVGAVLPWDVPGPARKALRANGLKLYFFDPDQGEAARISSIRALAFNLAKEACDFLHPVAAAKILFKIGREAGSVSRPPACRKNVAGCPRGRVGFMGRNASGSAGMFRLRPPGGYRTP